MKVRRFRRVLEDRAAELKGDIAKRARGEKVLTHIPTGWTSVDSAFGGIEIGVQTLVIGHSGDGKTTFLHNLVENAARAGLGVLFVVLEDPARKVADKSFARQLGVSANLLGRLEVDADIPERLDIVVSESEWADRIAFHAGLVSPGDVLTLVAQLVEVGVGGAPLSLVAVDYAQAFSDAEEGLEQICGQMAHALNQVAIEHQIAVVFGSQVRTKVLERGERRHERTGDVDGFRPMRGDAMWSQRLMQYSKAVWTIFRPGRWRRDYGDTGAKDDVVELTVAKANFGPEGKINLGWEGKTGRVFDIEKSEKKRAGS